MKFNLFVALFSPVFLFQGAGDLYMKRWRQLYTSLGVSLGPVLISILTWIWVLNQESAGLGSTEVAIGMIMGWIAFGNYFVVWIVNNFRYIKDWANEHGKPEHRFSIIQKTLMILISFVPPVLVVMLYFFGMWVLVATGIY